MPTDCTSVSWWSTSSNDANAVVLLFASTLFVAASCGADHGPANERAIAIYTATIRAMMMPGGPTPTSTLRAPVFVVAADERSPDLARCAGRGCRPAPRFATVRFVDKRSEAVDEADPRKRVHQDGVLITLGKIPPGRTTVAIDAQRYEQAGISTTERVLLHRNRRRPGSDPMSGSDGPGASAGAFLA